MSVFQKLDEYVNQLTDAMRTFPELLIRLSGIESMAADKKAEAIKELKRKQARIEEVQKGLRQCIASLEKSD